jgi:2-dehydropantoate 2-reductase
MKASHPTMKIAVIGAGGVGGYFGARLVQARHDVSFIARGAHAAAIRASGLHVKSDVGDARIQPAKVFERPADIESVELVIVAVKLWDAGAAAKSIVPLVGESTVVMSLQNGIDKDDILASAVGRSHVLGASTFINAEVTEPGTVTHTGRLARVTIGELDRSRSARATAVGAAFESAGVDVVASDDIRRATWEKFVFLTAHSGLTALTRKPIGLVREHPATRALLLEAMREAVAVARAEGIAFDGAFAEEQLAFIDTLPPASFASMAKDLLKGNRLELPWLSGAVIKHGESVGVATPVHRAIYAGLVLHASGA